MDFVLQQVPSITTLLYTINTKWNDTIYDLTPQVYYGKGFVIEKLEEFSSRSGQNLSFKPIPGRQKYCMALPGILRADWQ